MVVFSQWPTNHSRLANSIIWMIRAKGWLNDLGFEAIFPWACDRFRGYLKPESYWLRESGGFSNYFESIAGKSLDFKSLGLFSRRMEQCYESENGIDPFKWDRIVVEAADGRYAFLSGKLNLYDREIVEIIKGYEFVICNEPFNFCFPDNVLCGADCYQEIGPRNDVFLFQRDYVGSVSNFRRSVGLHIRRGDYRFYKSGVFYYPDEFWLAEADRYLADGWAVWVFSNDLSDSLAQKLTLKGAILSSADSPSFEIDFIRMMQMDVLCGPPSTFTKMASVVAMKCYGLEISCVHYPPLLANH